MTSSVQHPTDPQVVAEDTVNPAPNPVRRSFTAEYRARVVAEYEAAPHGEKAGVLRREGLYQSQVRDWRAERDTRAAGLVCELAIYLAGSLHAKWHVFQTLVREPGELIVERPNKSPITAR